MELFALQADFTRSRVVTKDPTSISSGLIRLPGRGLALYVDERRVEKWISALRSYFHEYDRWSCAWVRMQVQAQLKATSLFKSECFVLMLQQ